MGQQPRTDGYWRQLYADIETLSAMHEKAVSDTERVLIGRLLATALTERIEHKKAIENKLPQFEQPDWKAPSKPKYYCGGDFFDVVTE